MTSQNKDSAEESGVFNTSDPFARDHDQHPEEQAEDEHFETAEEAGVRTNNPFENPESHHGGDVDGNESLPTSAISPGPDPAGFSNANLMDQVDGPTEGLPPDETSLDAEFSGVQSTDAHDYAGTDRNSQQSDATDPIPDHEALNSDVNGDRAERGTALYQNADPHLEKESENSSPSSSSDSDSQRKDSKPRVAFAANDKIDKAQTHDDQDESHHEVLDKVKSAAHDVKEKFHLLDMKSSGPFKGFNPTNVRMRVKWGDDASAKGSRDANNEVGILWRSRDNRKGRNSVVMPRTSMAYPNLPSKNRPIYTSSFKGVRRNLWRMVFTFPYWDMAFWSGWSYTWGSVLFVIDGIWAWIPYSYGLELEGIEDYGVGLLFFIGALLYQLGATMAYLESVNDGSFHGSAMRRFLEGHEDDKKHMLDEKVHHFFGHMNPHKSHQEQEEEEQEKRAYEIDPELGWRTIHRPERRGSIYPAGKQPGPRRGGVDLGEAEEGESHEYLTWRWWPTWEALKNHHRYEIGYIACSIQLFGATLYSWCGTMALPKVMDSWSPTNEYGGYWFPEICGSCCFIAASGLFLLETQEKWYKPMPHVMGWWIGVWAMVGSWGFLLNGVFGAYATATDSHWGDYQSELSSTWGSFGYLMSSLCQWYEAVNKHPVEVEEMASEPSQMTSYQVNGS